MKSVYLGIALMVVISALAAVVTQSQDNSASSAYSSDNGSVRLD